MSKSSERRLVLGAFKEATAPAGITGKFSASVPGNTAVPAVAGVNRPNYKVPSKLNAGGAPKLSGPPKGITPTVNLKTTTPTSVSNVSEASEVQVERLEKESTVDKTAAALTQVVSRLVKIGLLKRSGIHDVDMDVKSDAKQKETKPEVVTLESASDEKPKKAPEKKPEPKTSENEVDMKKDAAGVGPARRAISVAMRLAGKGKGKKPRKPIKPTRKADAQRMTSSARTSAGKATEIASNKAMQPGIWEAKPKRKAPAKGKGKAKAKPEAASAATAEPGMSSRNKLLLALGAGGAGGLAAGSAFAGGQGQESMAADPSVIAHMLASAKQRGATEGVDEGRQLEQGRPYDWGTAGNWAQDVGSGGMRGIGSILSALGLPGSTSLEGWASNPKTSQLVGAGGMTIGTLIALMLLKRLLGGSGER